MSFSDNKSIVPMQDALPQVQNRRKKKLKKQRAQPLEVPEEAVAAPGLLPLHLSPIPFRLQITSEQKQQQQQNQRHRRHGQQQQQQGQQDRARNNGQNQQPIDQNQGQRQQHSSHHNGQRHQTSQNNGQRQHKNLYNGQRQQQNNHNGQNQQPNRYNGQNQQPNHQSYAGRVQNQHQLQNPQTQQRFPFNQMQQFSFQTSGQQHVQHQQKRGTSQGQNDQLSMLPPHPQQFIPTPSVPLQMPAHQQEHIPTVWQNPPNHPHELQLVPQHTNRHPQVYAQPPKQGQNQDKKLAQTQPDNEKWTCDICKCSIFLWNKDQHLKSRGHVEAVKLSMAFPIPPTRKWDCRICLATVDSSDMGLHIFGDRHIAIVANQLNAARFWKRGDAGKPGPLNGNCENGNSGSLNESAGNRDTLDKSAVDTDGLNSEVQGHDGAMEINDTEKAVDYEDDWNPDEYQFWSGGENELVEGGGGGSGEGDHQ